MDKVKEKGFRFCSRAFDCKSDEIESGSATDVLRRQFSKGPSQKVGPPLRTKGESENFRRTFATVS